MNTLSRIGSLSRRLRARVGQEMGVCVQCGKKTRSHLAGDGVKCHSCCSSSSVVADGGKPNWREVFEAAKQNRLGVDEDSPVSKGDIVSELRKRGFSPGFFDRAVNDGVLELVKDDAISPVYTLVKELDEEDIAESGPSTEETKDTGEAEPQEEGVYSNRSEAFRDLAEEGLDELDV